MSLAAGLASPAALNFVCRRFIRDIRENFLQRKMEKSFSRHFRLNLALSFLTLFCSAMNINSSFASFPSCSHTRKLTCTFALASAAAAAPQLPSASIFLWPFVLPNAANVWVFVAIGRHVCLILARSCLTFSFFLFPSPTIHSARTCAPKQYEKRYCSAGPSPIVCVCALYECCRVHHSWKTAHHTYGQPIEIDLSD